MKVHRIVLASSTCLEGKVAKAIIFPVKKAHVWLQIYVNNSLCRRIDSIFILSELYTTFIFLVGRK